MKKIILYSFFVVSLASLTSCTADPIATTSTGQTVHADDTGGQSGTINPTRP